MSPELHGNPRDRATPSRRSAVTSIHWGGGAPNILSATDIAALMCDLTFPARELRLRYGDASDELLRDVQALIEADQDRLIERDGEAFRFTERGRPFVRAIAACFDA